MIILNVIVAILSGLMIFFLGLGIARVAGKSKDSEEFTALLQSITQSEVEAEELRNGLPPEKSWTGYWLKLGLDSGWKPVSVESPARLALMLIVGGSIVGFFVFQLVGALLLGVGSVIVLRTVFVAKAKTRKKLMEKQLPNLISGMRANLQANLTPQQAILSQVDEIPAPLGDELKILRQEVNVNVPLETALTNLSNRVPSREIKFLVSSVKIAISSGVDLEPQLQTIQGIIVQRTKIANHLAAAVASVQPSIYVAAIAIPAGFLFSYASSEQNKIFWGTTNGLIGLAVIGFLYVIGLFLARKLVQKVEKA